MRPRAFILSRTHSQRGWLYAQIIPGGRGSGEKEVRLRSSSRRAHEAGERDVCVEACSRWRHTGVRKGINEGRVSARHRSKRNGPAPT